MHFGAPSGQKSGTHPRLVLAAEIVFPFVTPPALLATLRSPHPIGPKYA